jgi:hypothetical protein
MASEHWGSNGFANTDFDLALKKDGIHKLIAWGSSRTRDGAEKGPGDRLPHGRGSVNTRETRSLDHARRA